MKPTNAELKSLLTKWQPRLGLSHWDISIRWAHGYEMNSGSLAEVHHNSVALRADILVLDRDEEKERSGEFFQPPSSVEDSVVHELVHIVLSIIEEQLPKTSSDDLERAVVTLTRALLPQRKKGNQ